MIEELKPFMDYGLASVVIVALFYTLKMLGTLGLEKIEAILLRTANEMKAMRDEHRIEREEWRTSQERMVDKLEQTIENLADAIRTSTKT